MLADGTFSKSFTVPAQPVGGYKIEAFNNTMKIRASTSFAVGNMVVLMSKSSAPVGATITISGTGFSYPGTYNITIGSKTLVSSAAVSVGGVFSQSVVIPTLAAGAYTVTVYDIITGIPITAQFTVSSSTSITLEPSSFPSGFNVSVTGIGFAYSSPSINFIIYNKTSAGVLWGIWTMYVYTTDAAIPPLVAVNSTGYLDGWWNFNSGTLSLANGVYYVNATDSSGFKAQATVTVVSKTQSCVPRKTSFASGEALSFNIQYSFKDSTALNSYLKVYDPNGNVYFSGDKLVTWVAVGDYYVVPLSAQTAGGNPMLFPDDAPTGTWTYKWVSGDKTLATGSFTVTSAPVTQIAEQVLT